MCLQPISLYNRSLRLHSGDPIKFTVSCGKCPQCISQKKTDAYIRGYYEYLDCKRAGGYTYFETLTYNDQHVPTYKGVMHFNKEHIQKFMKRLRRRLERAGFGKIKYLVTCEYGKQNSQRPHYHVLFYVYDRLLPVYTLRDFINLCWTSPFSKSQDHFGFIDRLYTISDRILSDSQRVEYVTKYVVKDYSFCRHFLSRTDSLCRKNPDYEAIKKLQSPFEQVERFIKVDDELKEIYNRCKPFRLNSINLGMGFLDDCTFEELCDGKTKINFYQEGGSISKYVTIPSYYLRKVFYDPIVDEVQKVNDIVRRKDGSPIEVQPGTYINEWKKKKFIRWELNENGIKYKSNSQKLQNEKNRLVDSIDSVIATASECAHEYGEDFEAVRKDVVEFYNMCGSSALADYKMFYRDVFYPTIVDAPIPSIDTLIRMRYSVDRFVQFDRHEEFSIRLGRILPHCISSLRADFFTNYEYFWTNFLALKSFIDEKRLNHEWQKLNTKYLLNHG